MHYEHGMATAAGSAVIAFKMAVTLADPLMTESLSSFDKSFSVLSHAAVVVELGYFTLQFVAETLHF